LRAHDPQCSTTRAASNTPKPPKPVRHSNLDLFSDDIDDELEELSTASNAVIDMVRAGKLDEARTRCA
jgi:hypothetical protein